MTEPDSAADHDRHPTATDRHRHRTLAGRHRHGSFAQHNGRARRYGHERHSLSLTVALTRDRAGRPIAAGETPALPILCTRMRALCPG